MSYPIIIEYKPILNTDIINTRNLTTTLDQLYGIIITSYSITSNDRIKIKLSNNDIVDINQANNLPYFGYYPDTYEYTAKIMNYDVSFNGLELIQGSIQLCLILGIDPSSIITNFKNKGMITKLSFGRYLGMVTIHNLTEYNNGIVIDLDDVKDILPPILFASLSKSLKNCFPEYPVIGVPVPCDVYIISDNEDRDNVIATAAITLFGPESIGKYKDIGAYIFNVCANSEYRGQGLSKCVMISMLNDYISKGYHHFTLEVLPDNKVAYSLYLSLGFKKVDTTTDNIHVYDLLLLSI